MGVRSVGSVPAFVILLVPRAVLPECYRDTGREQGASREERRPLVVQGEFEFIAHGINIEISLSRLRALLLCSAVLSRATGEQLVEILLRLKERYSKSFAGAVQRLAALGTLHMVIKADVAARITLHKAPPGSNPI
jgi:hypothetical protein